MKQEADGQIPLNNESNPNQLVIKQVGSINAGRRVAESFDSESEINTATHQKVSQEHMNGQMSQPIPGRLSDG